MTRPTFVHPETRGLAVGDTVRLDGPEGHHAAVVRRLRVGESLTLTDGRGARADAEVTAVGKGVLELDVRASEQVEAPRPRLIVVQALTKGERGELAVELVTEVGADVVVPWAADRCVVRWSGERGARSLRRWRSTAHEAAKQSRRSWFPEVTDLQDTSAVGDEIARRRHAFVLHEAATLPLREAFEGPLHDDVVLVVGPEGGITDEELTRFREAGAQPVRLGSEVLRASTAGVVAAGALLSDTPRWA